jgi:hypothetical protein
MDVVEISNFLISARNENWYVAIGKFESPFGRYYFPLRTNPRLDAPFIRTEAIQWRETGILLRHERGLYVGELAFTNGNEDLETNSSKAVVARVGLEDESWALGGSIKMQDGIGSEGQKQFNNHVGVDGMIWRGNWRLSGEAIYDEYGFLKPGFDPLDITWQRSIYGRDVHNGYNIPAPGIGYYADLAYEGSRWYVGLNYGEYYPQKHYGDTIHDRVTRRGMLKMLYNITPGLQSYCVLLAENEGFFSQAGRPRNAKALLMGFQGSF